MQNGYIKKEKKEKKQKLDEQQLYILVYNCIKKNNETGIYKITEQTIRYEAI